MESDSNSSSSSHATNSSIVRRIKLDAVRKAETYLNNDPPDLKMAAENCFQQLSTAATSTQKQNTLLQNQSKQSPQKDRLKFTQNSMQYYEPIQQYISPLKMESLLQQNNQLENNFVQQNATHSTSQTHYSLSQMGSLHKYAI